MKLNKNDRKEIIRLICNEQTHMIIKCPESYESDSYKHLEKLKVRIKDMEKKLVTIKFNEIKRIQDFVKKANSLKSDITVHSDNRYIVDGKSLMGLFSLDLSKPLGVEILEKEPEEKNDFIKFCKELEIVIE